MLIAAQADVNARDSKRCSPLHWAVSKNAHGPVEVLLAAGADVGIEGTVNWLNTHVTPMGMLSFMQRNGATVSVDKPGHSQTKTVAMLRVAEAARQISGSSQHSDGPKELQQGAK